MRQFLLDPNSVYCASVPLLFLVCECGERDYTSRIIYSLLDKKGMGACTYSIRE